MTVSIRLSLQFCSELSVCGIFVESLTYCRSFGWMDGWFNARAVLGLSIVWRQLLFCAVASVAALLLALLLLTYSVLMFTFIIVFALAEPQLVCWPNVSVSVHECHIESTSFFRFFIIIIKIWLRVLRWHKVSKELPNVVCNWRTLMLCTKTKTIVLLKSTRCTTESLGTWILKTTFVGPENLRLWKHFFLRTWKLHLDLKMLKKPDTNSTNK